MRRAPLQLPAGLFARRCKNFWRVCTLADADGQQLANSYKQLLE
jgi:hypothetical protein